MDVTHSIEIIANVDGVRVHRVMMDLAGRGTVSDAMGDFDPAMAVVRTLRQEANLIEEAIMRERRQTKMRRGHTVIDAVPGELDG